MKFEHTEVWGFEHAIRGCRNPLESWDKSDSRSCTTINCDGCRYHTGIKCTNTQVDLIIGIDDLALMQRLIKAGSEQRKFMRQIMVGVDITAPLFWWKEFDTYKVGTVANSTSTMHKLASTPITKDCFEMGDFETVTLSRDCLGIDIMLSTQNIWNSILTDLEALRQKYFETKDKR